MPEGPEAAAGAASSVVGLQPGAEIASPNANPEGVYLRSRNIANLQRLGAPSAIVALAARADSRLDTQAPDGRLTIEELVAIEQPGLVEQLAPSERQVLPDLWRVMASVKGDAPAVAVPALEPIAATDISEPATTPLEPATLAVASFRPEVRRTLALLEATHDSDDDDQTVSKADLEAAIANPAGFQPWELEHIKAIVPIFLDRAGTKLEARLRVPEAVPVPTYDLPKITTWGPATLNLAKGIEYTEKRTKNATTGDLDVTITGSAIQRVVVTVAMPNQLLFIDDDGERETFAPAGVLEIAAGTKTVEVWANGVRIGTYRAKLPQIASAAATVDLTRYADYKFVFGTAPTALERNYRETTTSENGTRFHATFQFTKDGYDSGNAEIAAAVATPAFPVAPGRYAIGNGLVVHLYPQGVVTLTRGDGFVERALVRGHQFVLPPTSDLRFSFDPKTNNLVIKGADGATLFSGALKSAMRTG